jgi:Zn-dependent protease
LTICYHCGENVTERYICERCGKTYCSLHKNPIDHECNLVIEAEKFQSNLNSNYETQRTFQFRPENRTGLRGTTDGTYTWYRQEKQIPDNAFDPDSGIHFKGILLAHKSEFTHFVIGGILIFLIGIISFFEIVYAGYIWALFLLSTFYMTAFLFHEFGHRQIAMHYGLQTKFRLLTFGMLLTLFSLIIGISSLIIGSTLFPMLALPGAVVVLGLDKISRKTGLCKAAGPSVNLIYGVIILLISFAIPRQYYPLNYFFGYAAYFNFMLGSFNMIPLGILDGQNIWKWNKRVYISLIIPLITLLILTLSLINAPVGLNPYFPI